MATSSPPARTTSGPRTENSTLPLLRLAHRMALEDVPIPLPARFQRGARRLPGARRRLTTPATKEEADDEPTPRCQASGPGGDGVRPAQPPRARRRRASE